MGALSVAKDIVKFGAHLAKDYRNDNGSLIAAAVSFYAFLSLIPLLLLAISISAFFLGSVEQAQTAVMRLFGQYYPGAAPAAEPAVRGVVKDIVASRMELTWLSIGFLVWSGLSLTNSLSKAINAAWGVEVRRGPMIQRLLDSALLLAALIILGISVSLTLLVEVAKAHHLSVAGLQLRNLPLLWSIIGYVVPLIASMMAFYLLYQVAPNVRVRAKAALVGAVFSGVLWEIAKVGFGIYISRFVSASSIYGSLTGVVLLMVWLNYSSIVLILGAEVASEWQG